MSTRTSIKQANNHYDRVWKINRR